MFKNLIRNIAKRFGQELLSSHDIASERRYSQLLELFILNNKRENSSSNHNVRVIIFSKDRALQLDALLRSFFYFSNREPKINVLYHSSNSEFESGYSKLINDYKDKKIIFTKENQFKSDLIKQFESLKESKVLFLVDDILFKNKFDFDQFSQIDPKQYIASLRHGKHLSYCYTLEKTQKLPHFNDFSSEDGLSTWNWSNSEHDWAYPISLDGHLFDSLEMKLLINELDYKAPNSLEHALQLMNPLFKQRLGLCFEQSIIINNPCNKVQTENDNISGDAKIDELNKKWLDGYKINFLEFEGIKNKSAHQDLIYSFTKDD